MTIIGLTGGIACGKTVVAARLSKLGAAVIDADEISRALTAPGGAALPAIRDAFGDGVFDKDGRLRREALAKRVFENQAERERLNAILHPMVQARMREETENCRKMGVRIVVLDVPLLYEAGMEGQADAVVCVSAAQETQIARLKARDGMSREQALARIRSQWPLAEKERRADFVISTDQPEEDVNTQTVRLYTQLCERSPK